MRTRTFWALGTVWAVGLLLGWPGPRAEGGGPFCQPRGSVPCCHPTFGYYPTCWAPFPPVPPCPSPTCDSVPMVAPMVAPPVAPTVTTAAPVLTVPPQVEAAPRNVPAMPTANRRGLLSPYLVASMPPVVPKEAAAETTQPELPPIPVHPQ